MRKKIQIEFDYMKKMEGYTKYPELLLSCTTKNFTIKDVGVTHRWITHWDDQGLLPEKNKEGKWRKFNLVEYVWLKMIIKLRSFNVPLEIIKNVRETLLDPITFDKLLSDEVRELAIQTTLDQSPDVSREQVEEILNKSDFSQASIHILQMFILDALLVKNHFAIFIDLEGNWIPFKEGYVEEFSKNEDYMRVYYSSHISISITEILSEFITEHSENVIHKKLRLVTDEEMEVIRALREEKVVSVRVRINEKSEIELIETTREEKADNAKRLSDLILNNGYQDITVKTQNGKVILCRNTRKLKL